MTNTSPSAAAAKPLSISLGMPKQRTLKDYIDEGLTDREAWRMDSFCAQIDPEMFFPEKGGSTRDAKRVCGACEVRSICLDRALEDNEKFGIWGGLSERERAKLRRASREAAGLAAGADDDVEDFEDFEDLDDIAPAKTKQDDLSDAADAFLAQFDDEFTDELDFEDEYAA